MSPSDAAKLISLLVLLILSGFFSSAETALTTVSKIKIRNMIAEGKKGAAIVDKLTDDKSKLLSTILIGNNIVNIGASSLATTLAISIFGSVGAGIATLVLTILILIFGEITPKVLASTYPERLSILYAPLIYALSKLFTPVIIVINRISSGILKPFGITSDIKSALITEDELRTIVDVSHEEGVIENEEHKMITNVVDFGDSLAKDVMVPRIDMFIISTETTYDELFEAFSRNMYTRIPVYDGDRDNIVGIINMKDVFLFKGDKTAFSVTNFMREPFFTYEHKKTAELFHELRKKRISLAIVLDEYAAPAGLISLEDLVEEIVGEIRDEYDTDEEDIIQKVSDNVYIVSGAAKLDEINEVLELNLESDDYDSIAGRVISLLGHIPHVGESVTEGTLTYEITKMDKMRIDKILLTVAPKSADISESHNAEEAVEQAKE